MAGGDDLLLCPGKPFIQAKALPLIKLIGLLVPKLSQLRT
jgi:hypothetical protein